MSPIRVPQCCPRLKSIRPFLDSHWRPVHPTETLSGVISGSQCKCLRRGERIEENAAPGLFQETNFVLQWRDVTTSVDLNANQWQVVERWQEYTAEARANLLRVVGVGTFYIIELLNHYGLSLGALELPPVEGVDRPFHIAVTSLAAIWATLVVAIHLCLRQRIFPWYLKFLSTGSDLVLLTSILVVADGPSSPLIVGYILIVILAALRLNLPLIWFSTLGAMVGYLALCGYARWFTDRAIGVPRYYEFIFLLAVALAGVALGQLIRRLPYVAADYAKRVKTLSDN